MGYVFFSNNYSHVYSFLKSFSRSKYWPVFCLVLFAVGVNMYCLTSTITSTTKISAPAISSMYSIAPCPFSSLNMIKRITSEELIISGVRCGGRVRFVGVFG